MAGQNELVKLKFDGQSHQVDIDTFTQVLINYSTVVQAAASELGASGETKVAICAIESGSLDVLVSIASSGFGGLLDLIKDNSNTITGIIAIAGGLYSFKKKLAGKGTVSGAKEVDEDNVTVNTDGGDVSVSKNVYNVYVNHPEATTAIDRTFERLEEMPEIDGFELSSNGEVNFRADRNEFSGIAASHNYESGDIHHELVEHVSLSVVKPFLGKSTTRKWELVYMGTRITATIADPEFQEHINDYSFSVGTCLEADLVIEQRFDTKLDTYLNHSYKVVKVYNVLKPQRTEPLF